MDIKESRKKAGLTQEQLANDAGVSLMSIRRYETGERSPNIETLKKIQDAIRKVDKTFDADFLDIFSADNIAQDQIELFEEYIKSLSIEEASELLRSINFTANSFQVIESENDQKHYRERLSRIIKLYGVLIRLIDDTKKKESTAHYLSFFKHYDELLQLIESHKSDLIKSAPNNVELLTKIPDYKK